MPEPNVFAIDLARLRPEQIAVVANMTLEEIAAAVTVHRRFNEVAGQLAETVANHLPSVRKGLTARDANELEVAVVNLFNLLGANNQAVEEGFLKFVSRLSIVAAETGETKQ